MSGKKAKFDFDEFYRAHYGEARRRQTRAEEERRRAMQETQQQTMTDIQEAVSKVLVVAAVLVVGWLGFTQRRHRQHKE